MHKKLLLYFSIALMAFVALHYILLWRSSISLMLYDGSCVEMEPTLYKVASELTLVELESRLSSDGYLSDRYSTFRQRLSDLKSHYTEGDEIFELETNRSSWNGLYGSWGYGLIRNNCLIYHIEIIVS